MSPAPVIAGCVPNNISKWRLEMTDDTVLLEHVREALRADTRIGFDKRPIAFTLSNADLVL